MVSPLSLSAGLRPSVELSNIPQEEENGLAELALKGPDGRRARRLWAGGSAAAAIGRGVGSGGALSDFQPFVDVGGVRAINEDSGAAAESTRAQRDHPPPRLRKTEEAREAPNPELPPKSDSSAAGG
jgi:hypothetical protein